MHSSVYFSFLSQKCIWSLELTLYSYVPVANYPTIFFLLRQSISLIPEHREPIQLAWLASLLENPSLSVSPSLNHKYMQLCCPLTRVLEVVVQTSGLSLCQQLLPQPPQKEQICSFTT